LASDIGSAHFLLCTDGVIESDDATGDSFGGYKLEQVSITVWSLFIARFGALLTGKPKVFRVTVLLFLFSSFSIAQSLGDAPSVTAKRIDRAIAVAQFAAHGADAFLSTVEISRLRSKPHGAAAAKDAAEELAGVVQFSGCDSKSISISRASIERRLCLRVSKPVPLRSCRENRCQPEIRAS
jgi:hypothetical protein